MRELNELIEISKYAGQRFDLVQAGGGNTSVKTDDGKMYIKASGVLLSEVNEKKGYSLVDKEKVLDILEDGSVISMKDKRERDSAGSERVRQSVVEGDRPSIETFLHAFLYKYTSHVHSISVNILSSKKDWKELLFKIEPKALFVEYNTPGIELALEMKKQMESYVKEHGCKPEITFLQNHGLIVSSDSKEDVIGLTEAIVKRAEEAANVKFDRYKATNKISKLINESCDEDVITMLSEDRIIYDHLYENEELIYKGPFCPDGLVYCGYKALKIESLTDEKAVVEYSKEYNEYPKIIVYDGKIYIAANDLKKAKLIEDVLKNNLIILKYSGSNLNFLTDEEVAYLGNWEAEKYRQNK